MENIIKAWLSLFGDSCVFLLNDMQEKNIDISKVWKLEDCIAINEKTNCGLFFTPNGNYGSKNIVGEKIVRTENEADKYIAAIYVDLDKKMSKEYSGKTMNEYRKYVQKQIEELKLNCHYVVESGGGFHLYCFIKQEERAGLGESITKAMWKTAQETLASMFDGGDKSSHSINKLMRVPTSMWHKQPGGMRTKLYKVKDYKTWEEVVDPSQVSMDVIQPLSANKILQFINNQETPKIQNSKVSSNSTIQVNNLNIVEVMSHLEKYPKKNMEGKDVVFKTDGKNIWFVIDGQKVETDGYKMNKEKNYVHNFSMDEHGIYERPRGPVFTFLYYYFDKDIVKISEFLETEFGMTFFEEGTTTFLKVNTDNGVIFFQDDGVYYRSAKIKGKNTEEVNEKLFDEPFIIKGVCRTNYDKKGETKTKNMFLIISLLNREEGEPENMVLEILSSPQKFNDMYQKKGLTFMKSDGLLREFYSGMKKGWQQGIIPRYDFLYLNGYYKDYYLEGDRMYDYKGGIVDTTNLPIVIETPEIPHCNISKQISMSEYGEKIRQVFEDKTAMLGFIAFIALVMGHKFWNVYLDGEEQQIIVPGLILSGHTKSGKSTLVNILLNGFGLSSLAKKNSVKGTTLQPLKQMAADDYVMHWEEFTGDIGQDKENLIRDVLNKTRTARGLIDGTNAESIYRAGLILDGERLPESESVVNRCVSILMNPNGRKGNPEMLRMFNGLGFKTDFIQQLYSIDITKIKKDFEKANDYCYKVGIPDRYAMMYGMLVCVNRWFNIFFEDELIEIIKENVSSQDEIEKENTVLAMLINDICIVNRIKVLYHTQDGENYDIVIPIPNQYSRAKKGDIMDIIRRYGTERAEWKKGTLLIHLKSKKVDDTELRDELYDTFVMYRQSFVEGKFSDINFLDRNL